MTSHCHVRFGNEGFIFMNGFFNFIQISLPIPIILTRAIIFELGSTILVKKVFLLRCYVAS